jgi:spore maturation protein CgeB
LCDPCIGLDTHFEFESELPIYHDLKELRARIDYFLAHPEERSAVAKRARERALKEHTYTHRAQRMLDLIVEAHGPSILERGVRVQRTVAEMAERLGPEHALSRWLATLPPDTPFIQEVLTPLLRGGVNDLSYPEQVFAYMREVRNFAEAILKEPR